MAPECPIGGIGTTGMIAPMRESVKEEIDEKTELHHKKLHEDHHLRSAEKVMDYQIEAKDGSIGGVEDLIIDDISWEVIFLVVDTGHWLPGKKVLIAPKWIKEINWQVSNIVVGLTEHQIKNSPEYQPHQMINDVYERNLNDYYRDRSNYDDKEKAS